MGRATKTPATRIKTKAADPSPPAPAPTPPPEAAPERTPRARPDVAAKLQEVTDDFYRSFHRMMRFARKADVLLKRMDRLYKLSKKEG